jgi:hypothetical protein
LYTAAWHDRGMPAYRVIVACVLIAWGCATKRPAPAAGGAFLRAIAPLDEPRGYCLDVKGHIDTVDLTAPLQAHSCKRDIWHDDELFDERRLAAGTLYLTAFDRCIARVGATLVPAVCRDDAAQRWVRGSAGEIMPAGDAGACVTIEAAAGKPANGGYLKLDVAVAPCAPAASERQRWVFAR